MAIATKSKQELKLPAFDEKMDGSYYRAVYNGVKICGQIRVEHDTWNSTDYVTLMNNQGAGEPSDCDSEDYVYHIVLAALDEDTKVQAFSLAGVTSFNITEDSRLIAAIDRSKFKSFDDQWTITVTDRDRIEFGCGEVVLSIDEIKEFIRVQRIVNEAMSAKSSYRDTCEQITGNIDPEDVNLDEASELVKKVEAVMESRKQFVPARKATKSKKK